MRQERPSLTAIKIARGIAFVAEDPRVRELLPPGTVELNHRLLREANLMTPKMETLYRKKWFRSFARFVERHTTPGQMMTLPIRKRFVDDEIQRAILGGARQLLVVGAGFDTVGLRIAEQHPDVKCFELDHPATQRVKREAVTALELSRPNFHWVAADLSQAALADALNEASGWRRDNVAVIVVEGVLMYLDEPDVSDFFDAVHATCGVGSTLVFTHISTDESGALVTGKHGAVMRAILKVVGEPLRWGIHPEALPGFVESKGYILKRSPTPEEQRIRYLEPVGLGDEVVGDIELMASVEVA